MSRKIFYILWSIISLQICYSTAYYSRCGGSQKCIPLNSCAQMLRYVRPGPSRNVAIIRKNICGFQHKTSLVCCPSSLSVGKNLYPVRPSSPSGEGLLPKHCGRPMIQNKIFGGKPTPIGAYPWVVALGYTEPGKNGYIFDCSGSIINERYILTAAHCVARKHLGRRRFAIINLGVWNIAKDADCQESISTGMKCFRHMLLGFEDVVMHPKFDDEEKFENDIALIRLNITLNFDSDDDTLIEPVCLPPSNVNEDSFISGRTAIAAGWGLTEFKNYSNIMMSVELPIVSNKQCLERYKSQFVGQQLCAGGIQGQDTCIGDSGGPLVLSDNFGPPFIQVGIVSFGRRPCGSKSVPSVYTSVAKFRNWIVENLKP